MAPKMVSNPCPADDTLDGARWHWELNPDTNRARRRLTSLIETNAL